MGNTLHRRRLFLCFGYQFRKFHYNKKLFGIPFIKFIDTAGAVHNFLFAGIKRVAFRTDIHLHNVALFGRSAFKPVAARALEHGGMIIWVRVFFHNILPLPKLSAQPAGAER
jgi:hypothetical protein